MKDIKGRSCGDACIGQRQDTRQTGRRQAGQRGGKPTHPERKRDTPRGGGKPTQPQAARRAKKGGTKGLVPEPPKAGPGILPMEGH